MSELNKNLIIDGQLTVNTVRYFDLNNEQSLQVPPDDADWMVTLDTWVEHQALLTGRQFPVAVLIASDVDFDNGISHQVQALCQADIALIAIDFPSYTDGRGYSLAQLLRNFYHWSGELRAVGDVMIDTVYYQARCGFDSFLIKPGHDAQLALAALHTFSETYQKSYRQPVKSNTP